MDCNRELFLISSVDQKENTWFVSGHLLSQNAACAAWPQGRHAGHKAKHIRSEQKTLWGT